MINSKKLIHFPLESRVYSSELQPMQRWSPSPSTARSNQRVAGPVSSPGSVVPVTLIGGGSLTVTVD